MPSTPHKPPTAVPAEALGLTLERILAHPLCALRASIESLATELDQGSPRGAALDGALEEVTRLARDVETLVELTAPRPLAPMRCSMEEVTLSALRGLSTPERERVRHALPTGPVRLDVDGPLLARCLTYLLQAALAGAPDWVLLRGSSQRERTVFTIVRPGGDAGLLQDRIDPRQGRDDLTRAVRVSAAERDLARMGAHLAVMPTDRGLTCISVELGPLPVPEADRRRSKR